QPVPVGVVGELYIGGEGLARGYLDHPDLTAERFIANPFDERGSRLYRTGDRVRYLTDGNLEFVGRIDHHIKIRGLGVDLGEIEAALLKHPSIQKCVVAAHAEDQHKQLIAYLVMRDEDAPDIHALRAYLLKSLPDYMVPAAFVRMEQLPLTPN